MVLGSWFWVLVLDSKDPAPSTQYLAPRFSNRLKAMKFTIESILSIHKLCMSAGLNNPAFIKNYDDIGILYC